MQARWGLGVPQKRNKRYRCNFGVWDLLKFRIRGWGGGGVFGCFDVLSPPWNLLRKHRAVSALPLTLRNA